MFLPALVRVSVCVSVSLSLSTVTKKIVDGFVPNYMGSKFPRGKWKTKFVFRYDQYRDVEVTVKKLREM